MREAGHLRDWDVGISLGDVPVLVRGKVERCEALGALRHAQAGDPRARILREQGEQARVQPLRCLVITVEVSGPTPHTFAWRAPLLPMRATGSLMGVEARPIQSIAMTSVVNVLVMSCALSILAGLPTQCHGQATPDTGVAIERRRTEIERTFETLGSDPSVAAVVEQVLTDADPALRLAAVGAILGLVQPGSFSVGPDLCLAGDFDWFPPHLARLADAVSGRLHDVDPKIRAAAIGVVNGRELMPQRLRAACVGGARGAMSVEMEPQGYLSDDTVRRLQPLVADPDREVRSTALWALLSGAPVDDAYVDLVFEAAKNLDGDVRGNWYIGVGRVGADVEHAVAVVERLATAPLAVRGHACNYLASWAADEHILHSLLLWHAQESDATTKACLQEIVGRHTQRLAYLKANAPALARVRALEMLVKAV
jgi:hypothetical protein